MLSYWERETFLSADVIIVGGGITGLSTALSIKEKRGNLSVLILEKDILARGASTRNAGFACFGSPTELLEDIEIMGAEKALQLVAMRWSGLQLLRKRLTNKELGISQYGGYELLEDSLKIELSDLNNWLMPVFGQPVFQDASNKLHGFGFKGYDRMIFTPFEAQLDTGKTIDSLWRKAEMQGIRILTGSKVVGWKSTGGVVNVETLGMDESLVFKTKKLIIANNAFMSMMKPAMDIQPGRGQVFITHPISDLKFRGSFHTDRGYVYFRNVGNRVLIGGGRNKDFEKEKTLKQGENQAIIRYLHGILEKRIIPGVAYKIDIKWSGIMAFGQEKYPILHWSEPDVYLAVRLGGMGMALASHIGEHVSKEIINSIES
jgi:gamma-glutamylputrescine oxidase